MEHFSEMQLESCDFRQLSCLTPILTYLYNLLLDTQQNMDLFRYNNLQPGKLKKALDQTIKHLRAGDFRAADVRKMPNAGFYRAKLDDTNRLLFQIARYEGRTCLLLLEIILNHAYDKSRFLNGAVVDETKLVPVPDEKAVLSADLTPVNYLNPRQETFHILDKILSFDDPQSEVLGLPLPLIVMGSAGSGKTALTLEKLKTLPGRVLYTTLSSFLTENARALYYAHNYENDAQEVEFLSFLEYLSTIGVPEGQEVTFRSFEQWIWRYKQSHKIKDAHKVFEEFRGVLTGAAVDKPYLSLADYTTLGIRQSIFPATERPLLYDLFLKYLDWLQTERINNQPLYDTNLLAYRYLERITPTYDWVVVDEVQDITNVQLLAILRSLRLPQNFLLGGDANQIVHPNFFSWSQVKTLFYKQEMTHNLFRVLLTNYRNTPEVTQIANQLLLIKNARFGSVDKESTYLVRSNARQSGEVAFVENNPRNRGELDGKTRRSANVAVLVLRPEDKAEARKHFQTPLLFSVQEAKGLEYQNVILYNVVSNYEREFRELTAGVTPADLTEEAMTYGRAKDKSDKSLDEFKFYVNSLYVAITRAVQNLYVVETNRKHDLLALLGLTEFKQNLGLKEQTSSTDDWQREARRLELQGKQEQADLIRKQVLKVQPVPWEITTRANLPTLIEQATNPAHFNKKAKDRLFEYALFYGENHFFAQLSALQYRPADKWEKEGPILLRRLFQAYYTDVVKTLLPDLQRYGMDFRNPMNLPPFTMAISNGAVQIADHLIKNGAKTDTTDNYGRSVIQVAFLRALLDTSYKSRIFNRFYATLKAEPLRVQINHRLVKLDAHQAEYFMLQFMLAVWRTKMTTSTNPGYRRRTDTDSPTFQAADFINFYEGLTESVIPDYRRKRPYISSILGKNEFNGNDKYNKKLFFRVQQGHYVPNPLMEVQVGEQWVNVYDLTELDDLRTQRNRYLVYYLDQIAFARQHLTANPDAEIPWDILEEQHRKETLQRYRGMM